MRDTFTDPRTGRTYTWRTGHSEESAIGKQRQITESANTANTGLVKQQGDVQPMVLKYKGTIRHKDQLEQFWAWFQLCETQTIHFTDFAGETYEVIITDFEPVRRPTIRNPADFANMPLWYFSYDISMEVVSVVSGVLVGVTP
jgi:hypothetical protein